MTWKLLSIVSLLFASCVTHDAIPNAPGNIQALIEPGDKVRIVTKDNEETELVVVEVTDEAIVGENEKILFADIAEVEEVKPPNWGKFVLITLGIAFYAAAVVVSGGGGCYSGIY